MTEAELLAVARRRLEEVLQTDVADVPPRADRSGRPDAVWRVGNVTLILEAKSSASLAHLERAVQQLHSYRASYPDAIPVLVAPVIGPGAADIARRNAVSWLDATGRADIRGPRLRVRSMEPIAPRPIKTVTSPFSRRASHIVHSLLISPWRERDASTLAKEARSDNGLVTRILNVLLTESFITERRIGRRRFVKVSDPNALLAAWDERYKRPTPFSYALLASRDGFETERTVVEALRAVDSRCVVTALGAAAHYTRFGTFRRVTAYAPRSIVLSRLPWKVADDERGRNVALLPSDDLADIGTKTVGDVCYASPILTYLDLRFEAERAEEAREELRRVISEAWNEPE